MTIVKIILALLKLADVLAVWAQQQKWYNAGVDAEVARASAAILAKTLKAKEIREKVEALDEKTVDDLLRGLESDGRVSDSERQLLLDLPESDNRKR